MKNNLIILGAPGSGKGTQALKLVRDFGYKHISTGDLLRSEIAKGTELGKKVSGIIAAGNLVDDFTVLELLKANCNLSESSYIFDGFPRNFDQAKMLEESLLNGVLNYKAVYFSIGLDSLTDRVVNRRTCTKCGEIYNIKSKPPKNETDCSACGSNGTVVQRKDDTIEVVTNRLNIFKNTIGPMVDYYKAKNLLVELDASLDEVTLFNELKKAIG